MSDKQATLERVLGPNFAGFKQVCSDIGKASREIEAVCTKAAAHGYCLYQMAKDHPEFWERIGCIPEPRENATARDKVMKAFANDLLSKTYEAVGPDTWAINPYRNLMARTLEYLIHHWKAPANVTEHDVLAEIERRGGMTKIHDTAIRAKRQMPVLDGQEIKH